MARPSSALRGKVAVVTGSTRGIGLMIAASLAQAGAQIAICGRDMAGVEAVYQQLSAIPGVEVLGAACDVRHHAEVQRLADEVMNRFGTIDIWFNNAASVGPLARAADVPPAAWQGVIESNLLGTFNGTQVALHHMLPRNAGKIVNLVDAGTRGGAPTPFFSAYAASKAAILHLTQTVAAEYRESGLSILALAPGPTRTDLFAQAPALTPDAETARQQAQSRAGSDIVEVGEVAVRLASRETDGTTGKLYEVGAGVGQALRDLLRGRP